MTGTSFSVHLAYASADLLDGGDARPVVRALLADLRTVAAIRDATAEWFEGDEAVFGIALTDDGRVLTLSDDDTIQKTLTAQDLREAFKRAGMNLWVSGVGLETHEEDADEIDDADLDGELAALLDAEARGELLDDDADDTDDDDIVDDIDLDAMFEARPVRVASFSRRGALNAQFIAETSQVAVDYVEAGTWSLCRFATTELIASLPPTKTEGPTIELNLVHGGGDWIDVRVPGATSVPFWPAAERDTELVIDLGSISVPETAEVYRRLIAEGDGVRDELLEIARVVSLDVDAAHHALLAEQLGGVVGADARLRAFLAAFGIPAPLIDLALAADGSTPGHASSVAGLTAEARIEPQGWWRTVGQVILGGYDRTLPLTKQSRWDARLARKFRENPLLTVTVATVELVAGVVATRRFRGGWKTVGVLLIVDAVADLVITGAQRNRRP